MFNKDYSQLSALVVDDNRSVRELTRTLLLNMGIGHVKTARDSAHAISFLKTETFDLILSDAVMPGMDGIGLLNMIRENPKTSNTPFIIISGFSDRALSAAACGVTDFILKPYSFEVFSNKVASVLATAESTRNLSDDADRQSGASLSVDSTVSAWPLEVEVDSSDKEASALAEEEELLGQILSSYGATPVRGYHSIHGNTASCYVSVFVETTVNRKHIDLILQECAERRVHKIVILGMRFDGGLFTSVSQYAESRGIEISFSNITMDSTKSVIGFAPVTQLGLVSHVNNGRISFEITSFSVADAESIHKFRKLQQDISAVVVYEQQGSYAFDIAERTPPDEMKWKSLISCWGICLNYTKPTQILGNLDWNSLCNAGNAWKTPEFGIDKVNKEVAVVVRDFLGNTSIKTIEVTAQGIVPIGKDSE